MMIYETHEWRRNAAAEDAAMSHRGDAEWIGLAVMQHLAEARCRAEFNEAMADLSRGDARAIAVFLREAMTEKARFELMGRAA